VIVCTWHANEMDSDLVSAEEIILGRVARQESRHSPLLD